MHFAILSNNYDNAKLLLKHQANPNAKDSSQNTPMHFAVAAKNLSMVRMLDDYGANATHKNVDGICAIDVSITEDMRDIKLHFLAQQKYKNFDFSGLTSATLGYQQSTL